MKTSTRFSIAINFILAFALISLIYNKDVSPLPRTEEVKRAGAFDIMPPDVYIGKLQQHFIDNGITTVVIRGETKEVVVDYVWGEISDKAYCDLMGIEIDEYNNQ